MVQWLAIAVAVLTGVVGVHPLWVLALIPLGLLGRLEEADWSVARLFSGKNGGFFGAVFAATLRMAVGFAVGYVLGMFLGIGGAIRIALP